MAVIPTRPLSGSFGLSRRRGRSEEWVLRFALRADATVCGGLGLLVAMAADPLSRLSGLPATTEWFLGAGFVAYGALLYLLAGVGDIRRNGLGNVVASVAFAVAVVMVLIAGVLPLTGAGVAMTLATVIATLGFASLQYLGVRRLA
jgi:hypothetical protein